MCNFKSVIKVIMLTDEQAILILKREVDFQTSRSGGKGGQNVNKVETKVEIEFNVVDSVILSASQKDLILKKYPGFVNGYSIKLTASKHRSQLENKEEVQEKLIALLNKLLKPKIKRVPTKPSRSSIRKKTETKKHTSEKKLLRRKID